MNVNLHLLNASGSLSQFEKEIKSEFSAAVSEISKIIKLVNVDIVIYDNPEGAIPEIGLGGYTQNDNLIFIPIDPKFANLPKSIKENLKRTMAHELHHVMRWRKVGYGNTLLEAIITEGLADNFDLEVFGGNPPLHCQALKENEIKNLLSKAKNEFDDIKYDHNAWFFGSKEKNIPRWTGYSLGFYLVNNYLKKNPKAKPSAIYEKPAKDFLLL